MPEHLHEDIGRGESVRVMRDRRREARRREIGEESSWSRDDFFHDLGRVSQKITREIEQDPAQAEALDRSREQARRGQLISQEDLDRESTDGDG